MIYDCSHNFGGHFELSNFHFGDIFDAESMGFNFVNFKCLSILFAAIVYQIIAN